ncbi:hypothetical protein PGTUg99_005033 [Puccinia graminis f. sp. tritici]|uniref:Uncharacterized protein n=1 Tax=Puccinia graminis f. sp. tritici TaxID=56615 RepID=A0A5B0LJ03_PUCGR|nr:hypothetical protein PGTUg99_005033 [Puccinia graminis f. sp. tritici]
MTHSDALPSQQIWVGSVTSPPPWLQICKFDVNQGIAGMWSSCSGGVSPNRLLSYGTPFYGLYYQKAETKLSPVTAISQIMMIARAKLLYHEPSSGLSQSQIFALLGSTIQPQLYTAWDINTETLSSHAAHCMYSLLPDVYSHLL